MHVTPKPRQEAQDDALRTECYAAIDHLRVALEHTTVDQAALALLQAAMLFTVRAVDSLPR